MNRELWKDNYLESNPPFWPCPACGRETLQPIPKSLVTAVPSGYRLDPDITPVDYEYRFNQFFQCVIKECGDVICVSGSAALNRSGGDASSDDAFIFTLYPRNIYRGLPIIACPMVTPEAAKRALESACTLFWVDLGSCANKLRISVERILDELGIPEARNLNERIKTFEKIDADHAETFHALREVGNVGSHRGDNTRETILDAFEVFEDALRDLFGGQKDRIESLKKKIRTSRGI
ncbi:DUF4145 domain-containing protein [Bradyrhizobium sp.]|uniref:DUF4145 domain-containing protein n=1 Tax=Bradyrhizobium sp. TaxID=376 RepID=UPI002735FF0C|nr:DUF4145 domain-containing protein [Bradyrhizobium sp.]MDP3077462.1 DUF4145 domain-containing protein [Bradyrhizobium sp.]